jgi:flagellar FliL protein
MLPLMLAMVFTILLTLSGVVGVLVYLAKVNKLPSGLASSVTSGSPDGSKTSEIVLDPLLVNLVDADGHGYLRAGVTLRVQGTVGNEGQAKTDSPSKDDKVATAVSAPLRDIVLDVLGRQQVADLLQPDGKDKLKVVLKSALRDRDPDVRVVDIYFTEFLVQQ